MQRPVQKSEPDVPEEGLNRSQYKYIKSPVLAQNRFVLHFAISF